MSSDNPAGPLLAYALSVTCECTHSLCSPKGLRYYLVHAIHSKQVIVRSAVVSSLKQKYIPVVVLEASSTSMFVYGSTIEQYKQSNARHPKHFFLTAIIRNIEQVSSELPGLGYV